MLEFPSVWKYQSCLFCFVFVFMFDFVCIMCGCVSEVSHARVAYEIEDAGAMDWPIVWDRGGRLAPCGCCLADCWKYFCAPKRRNLYMLLFAATETKEKFRMMNKLISTDWFDPLVKWNWFRLSNKDFSRGSPKVPLCLTSWESLRIHIMYRCQSTPFSWGSRYPWMYIKWGCVGKNGVCRPPTPTYLTACDWHHNLVFFHKHFDLLHDDNELIMA